MNAQATIAALLAGADPTAGRSSHGHFENGASARAAKRMAWVAETMARIRAMHDAIDAAWDRRIDAHAHLGEAGFEAIDFAEFPEEAELSALMAEVEAVRDHDRWPRALYWSGI